MKQIQNKSKSRLDKIRSTIYYDDGDDIDGRDFLSRTVYETVNDDIDTGLLDASGKPIRRSREKIKIGFV